MELLPDEEYVGWNFDVRRWTFGVQYDGEDLYICLGPLYYLYEVNDDDMGTPRRVGRNQMTA
ncbi:hypothetical protein [Leisingera sp. M523]|uniref:hypothetical protein n=1 Tax=Leisingera sp. M523 TaxID=2867013 RepID=UPI0021A6DCE2|nr:hypothetical protein [Leisingera sp. M523]UWQ29931.1 hypothetical protein K3557_05115 [Leisingera sp. M523]